MYFSRPEVDYGYDAGRREHRAEPTSGQLADVDRLVEELRRERPELGLHEEFRPLLPRVLGDAPRCTWTT